MKISKIAGSISREDVVKKFLETTRLKTLGVLWEDRVTCDKCPYLDTCRELCDQFDAREVYLYCREVIDILTGELDLNDIMEADDV